ncbi:MAG: Holliday junction branch migration protein RuvA [Proteobacteria bacterium]|nr:Holliday junction branch migration protein RuvA [Pseudomonadota bacterium]
MIERLTGQLIEKNVTFIVLDVSGIGYEVGVPVNTLQKLPAIGANLRIYTYHYIREDSQQLFGFLEKTERNLFDKIIKVSGIGPKVGLAILSTFSPNELAVSITNKDVESLNQIPGIGKKTAERLILELNGKLEDINDAEFHKSSNFELLQALTSLGYSEKEARSTVSNIEYKLPIHEKIKEALKLLSK